MFTFSRSLISVLLSVSSSQASQHFGTRILHFFNRLFKVAEKQPSDVSLDRLCQLVSNLAKADSEQLQMWLRHVILGSSVSSPKTEETPEDNKKVESTSSAISELNNWPNLTDSSIVTSITHRSCDDQLFAQENNQLLLALTNYIVKDNRNVAENATVNILQALIPLGYQILSSDAIIESISFFDLMQVMSTLADAGSDKGHVLLFKAATEWLEIW